MLELTGQVTEITRFPVFEGSHSSVYRGRLGDQEVRDLHLAREACSPRADTPCSQVAIKSIRSLKSNAQIQKVGSTILF